MKALSTDLVLAGYSPPPALMEDDSAKAPAVAAAANADLTETTSTTDAAVGADDDACAHVVHVVKQPPPANQHPKVGWYKPVFESLGWNGKWRPRPRLGGSWAAFMKPTTNAPIEEAKPAGQWPTTSPPSLPNCHLLLLTMPCHLYLPWPCRVGVQEATPFIPTPPRPSRPPHHAR